ncbi:MAG: copper-translocating P-type ATPase [Lactobacillus sp.]|jgi:Cu+-exporting ATPase|nr:copper-translocating P-type ATPase [Lactobacillus sp.]MCH3906549.1 copper-translocating P-type ATPase [Lactobacillus sp.]MCH3989816.1 copper-translocating P-type ATPase [Lactobacillus sp.]MCH4068018.1 copper-translocating P-type ATPase [Lactobacillus sp.]MCI1304026.1 copper-translocating P-type ATPase [Lactobacillus sp.]
MKKITLSQRFWLTLLFSMPLIIQMLTMPLGWHYPGEKWVAFIATTVIMLLSARPYWSSAWAAFKHHRANMNTLVAVSTTVTYFYSLFALLTNRPEYFESAALVTLFVLLGDYLSERMSNHANDAVKKLMSLQAATAEVLRDGRFQILPLEEVVVGDRVRVEAGAKVPVDGKILTGTTEIDESLVTGESMPVPKKPGDTVIGATMNTTGLIEVQVTQTGKDTALAQIGEMMRKAQTSHAPIESLVDRVANIFVPAVLILALLTFAVWYVIIGVNITQAMLFGVSVIVIACPCALGLATPTALMVGMGRSARSGVLIKNGEILEKATKLQQIAFDKTGTLTKGKPVVTDVAGDRKQVLTVAAAVEQNISHPLAAAVRQAAEKEQIDVPSAINSKVIAGKGTAAEVAGHTYQVGNQRLISNQQNAEKWIKQATAWQQAGKTVSYVLKDREIIGVLAFKDLPKNHASRALNDLQKQGLTTAMISGDSEAAAETIAKQLGITQVIANVLPAKKVAAVKDLQAKGSTAFVGDGINDAPALAQADVGIAMGNGTDIAISSSDIVLTSGDLLGVPRAIALARKIFKRIKLNLFWAFIYNLLGIPIAAGVFAGLGLVLSPELAALAMAFSSVSVVTSALLLNYSKLKV